MKKLLCLFAALCLLLSLTACADPNASKENQTTDIETEAPKSLQFAISSNGKNYGVVGIGTYEGTDVVIPAYYEGIPVTVIADDAFNGCSHITSVTLPDNIVKIGNRAFKGCTGLSSITIPPTVVTMGFNVFEGCNGIQVKLSTKTIPEKWNENWNVGVGSVTYGTANDPTGNNGTNNSQTTTYSQGLEFAENDMSGDPGYKVVGIGTCKDEHVKIPTTYTDQFGREQPVCAIDDEAFKNCTFIKSITIGDHIYVIGERILMGCSNLESITVPFLGDRTWTGSEPLGYLFGKNEYSGSVKVSQHTLHGYNTSMKLEDYYIPATLRTVNLSDDSFGYGAFSGCSFLTSVTCKVDAEYNALSHAGVSSYAFYGCSGLTSITLAGYTEDIGDYAFYGCTNLETVSFTSVTWRPLKEIGYSAFEGCAKLKSFSLPEAVEEIGESAFAGCASLTSMTIPSKVTQMGREVFDEGCTSLTSITVKVREIDRIDWDNNWNKSGVQVSYNYS